MMIRGLAQNNNSKHNSVLIIIASTCLAVGRPASTQPDNRKITIKKKKG